MRRRGFLALLGPSLLAQHHPCPASPQPDFDSARPFEIDESWTRQPKPRPYLDRMARDNHVLERAYGLLRARPDALSLAAQGNWHSAMFLSGLNSAAGVGQCADIHSNGLFLPWHRAFLYFHERSLANSLGDSSFRLPVWRWDQTGVSPGGLLKPFVTSQWDSAFGNKIKKEKRLSRTRWLLEITNSADYERFGGGDNFGSAAQGNHSDIHSLAGGQMADLATAAHDPLFYMHHANIDRQWARWQQWTSACRPSGFRDLADVLNGKFADVRFYFHDIQVDDPQAAPELVYVTASQTLDYERTFGYLYRPEKLPACDGAVTEALAADANGDYIPPPRFRKLKSVRVANVPVSAGTELNVRMTLVPVSGAGTKVQQSVAILPSHKSHASALFTGLKMPKKIRAIESKMSDQPEWTRVPDPIVLLTSVPN